MENLQRLNYYATNRFSKRLYIIKSIFITYKRNGGIYMLDNVNKYVSLFWSIKIVMARAN